MPLDQVDLVIEAAVEKMEAKKQIFAKLDAQAVNPETLLATNTSALSLAEIAGATKNPGRVVGIHFFNPVHKMQLVEVVSPPQTSPETVQRAVQFARQIGKLPVVVKDSPGFLVNRILVPYLLEAGLLFESGARATEIDEAMLDFGMPMGPLRLIDEVGVDIAADVAATLAGKFSDRLTRAGDAGKDGFRRMAGAKKRARILCLFWKREDHAQSRAEFSLPQPIRRIAGPACVAAAAGVIARERSGALRGGTDCRRAGSGRFCHGDGDRIRAVPGRALALRGGVWIAAGGGRIGAAERDGGAALFPLRPARTNGC